MVQRKLDVAQIGSAHTANRVEDLQGLLHIVISGPHCRIDGSDDVPQLNQPIRLSLLLQKPKKSRWRKKMHGGATLGFV